METHKYLGTQTIRVDFFFDQSKTPLLHANILKVTINMLFPIINYNDLLSYFMEHSRSVITSHLSNQKKYGLAFNVEPLYLPFLNILWGKQQMQKLLGWKFPTC